MGDVDWPVPVRGITESVVVTREPAGNWNVAALGLIGSHQVAARTWGRTRTRRNFHLEGSGVIVFTRDPRLFVRAALDILEVDDPVIEGADAWVEVIVEPIKAGVTNGTGWEEWALRPTDAAVINRVVPTINRGFNAVIEASVAASRLTVDTYDSKVLRDRLDELEEVTRRCGGCHEEEAFELLRQLIE